MPRLLRTLLIAAGVFFSLGLILAATGLLYLLRGVSLPGPRVRDVLPLDELPKHDGAPLILFAGVWALVGLGLGAVARVLRAERLTAAALLALGVWLWTYLAAGVSILVVRQVPAHAAFIAAAHLRAVYLPAALAGLAGALLGRGRRTPQSRSPLLLAWLVATIGVLSVLDAMLPGLSSTQLAELSLARVSPVASALVAPLGLALILVARGLARCKRRAYHLGVLLLAGLAVLHELHRFDYGAIAAAAMAALLVARRQDFDAPGDPTARPRVARQAAGLALLLFLYGFVALWINRISADQPFTLHFALSETGSALVGLNLGGSQHLTDGFGSWFPISVFVAGLASTGWLLLSWLAPWRYRLAQEVRERQLTQSLVGAWGADTLAPFVLRADKSYFFSEDERAFLAYRVVAGVAIVSGNPIGPPEHLSPLLAHFIAFAHRRGWRIAILGASESFLDLYRAQGLHAVYHGDEAILDVESFSLEGRAIRKVRQSVTRLQAAGYRVDVLSPREIGCELREQLEAIAQAWRGAEPSRGFVMAIDALFRLEEDDAVFVVGRDSTGRAMGFLHFAVVHQGAALSLSSMPRLRTTPNGFNGAWPVSKRQPGPSSTASGVSH